MNANQSKAETLVEVFLNCQSTGTVTTEVVRQILKLDPSSVSQSIIERVSELPYSEQKATLLWVLARMLSRTSVQYEDQPASEPLKDLWRKVRLEVLKGLAEGVRNDTKNVLVHYIHPATELLIVQSDASLECMLEHVRSRGELSTTGRYAEVDVADRALVVAEAARAIEQHDDQTLAQVIRSSRPILWDHISQLLQESKIKPCDEVAKAISHLRDARYKRDCHIDKTSLCFVDHLPELLRMDAEDRRKVINSICRRPLDFDAETVLKTLQQIPVGELPYMSLHNIRKLYLGVILFKTPHDAMTREEFLILDSATTQEILTLSEWANRESALKELLQKHDPDYILPTVQKVSWMMTLKFYWRKLRGRLPVWEEWQEERRRRQKAAASAEDATTDK